MLYCANAVPNRAAVLRSFTMLSTDPQSPRSKITIRRLQALYPLQILTLTARNPHTQARYPNHQVRTRSFIYIRTGPSFIRPRPDYWFYPSAQAPTAALSYHLASPFPSLHRKCGRAWRPRAGQRYRASKRTSRCGNLGDVVASDSSVADRGGFVVEAWLW